MIDIQGGGYIIQDRTLAVTEQKVVGINGLQNYFMNLWNVLCRVEVTNYTRDRLKHNTAVRDVLSCIVDAHADGNKVMFIGNGGSAAIASHMAADWAKNGGIRTLSLNDPSMLTCLANDVGYEYVFAKQIEMHAHGRDVLVAISSSGRSPNILRAVQAAKTAECTVITMSGFDEDNPLRRVGAWNFYVPSSQYGPVEIAHLTLCHAMLDLLCASKEKAIS